MSTCLSCPLDSFFTLTLQADRSAVAVRAPKRRNTERSFLCMFRPSTGNLERTLQACAALRDIGDTHGKMPANSDFPKQRLDRAYLGYGRVGKRTHVILHLWKVCRKVRVSHRDHRRFCRGASQHLL